MTMNNAKKDQQPQPAFDLSQLKILGGSMDLAEAKTKQGLSSQEIQFLQYLISKGFTGGIA